MGGWKLEVAKMAMYMTFPVGLFYYFNQPEFFERWMMKKRKELFPPEDPKARRMLGKLMENMEDERHKKWEEDMKVK